MSQDNWNASVQNKQHDGALHSESADSNKNQAYTPSSGVPPNYASNGSMVDGVQSNMSENLAAGIIYITILEHKSMFGAQSRLKTPLYLMFSIIAHFPRCRPQYDDGPSQCQPAN